jgi:AcrR family transcriptional regulator
MSEHDLLCDPEEARWRQQRRQRIVASALQLFSERPYETVQMEDVARHAGVAKPTLYRYYAGKEELFLASIELALGDLETAVEQAAALHDTRLALRAVLERVLQSLGDCTAAIRAFDESEPALGDRGRALIRARVRNIRTTVSALLQRGRESGTVDTPDADLAAVALIGAARMLAAQIPASRRTEALGVLWSLIERGLLANVSPRSEDD